MLTYMTNLVSLQAVKRPKKIQPKPSNKKKIVIQNMASLSVDTNPGWLIIARSLSEKKIDPACSVNTIKNAMTTKKTIVCTLMAAFSTFDKSSFFPAPTQLEIIAVAPFARPSTIKLQSKKNDCTIVAIVIASVPAITMIRKNTTCAVTSIIRPIEEGTARRKNSINCTLSKPQSPVP